MVQRIRFGQRLWATSGLALLLCTLCSDGPVVGQDQQQAAEPLSKQPATADISDSTSMNELLIWIARQSIPTTYEEKKDWGQQREIVTGLRLVGRGRKLRTASRRKMVNHGTWKMYRVSLKDRQDGFHIELNQVRGTEDNWLSFEAVIEAHLEMFARWAKWNRGVQLISLNASADADVRLQLTGKMAIRIDPRKFPPDITVIPEVTSAELKLNSFRLHRISQLHGTLAHKIGDEAHKIIEKKLADKREELVAKINKQIGRNEDKLRVSLQEFLQQKWGRLISGLQQKKLR